VTCNRKPLGVAGSNILGLPWCLYN
jgi:hypothetical protein